MKLYKYSNKGFVGIVFLAVALIVIVIGAIATMSRNSTSRTSSEQIKTNVSVILKQTSDFKAGYDRKIINGSSADSITFNSAVGTGLFDPTPGAQYSVQHTPPSAVANFMGSGVPYTYAKLIQLPGIGSASTDFVVTVSVIPEACRMINNILYKDPLTLAPALSTGEMNGWGGGPTTVNDSANVQANYLGRPEGCVQITGGNYMYYKVMSEN